MRNIPSSDNRGAGASVGRQIKDVPNGGQIRVIPKPKPQDQPQLIATDYFAGDTCAGAAACPYPWGTDTSSESKATVSYTGPANAPFNGTQWVTTDENSNVRDFQNDGLGRLSLVVEAPSTFNYQTSYSYDFGDRLTGVTQGALTRSFSYDALGRLGRATNPESGVTTYTYDGNGNVKTRSDNVSPSRVVTNLYDALNRVTNKTYTDGTAPVYAATPPVTFCYDAVPAQPGQCASAPASGFYDRLTQVYSSSATVTYPSFDKMGRAKISSQTTNGVTYTFPTYTYNKQGSLASVTYPSGRALTYSFDATGRVSSLQGVQNSNTTSYAGPITYWGNGGVNQLTLAGGALSQSFTPEYRFRPVTVAANAGSASLLNLGYTYFLDGNVKTVTFTNPGLAAALTQTFGYDKTNRLSNAMETAAGSQTWVQNFCKA